MTAETTHTQRVVEVTQADLPLHCPMPADSMWCGIRAFFCRSRKRARRFAPTAARFTN
jgi:hypothetical protein